MRANAVDMQWCADEAHLAELRAEEDRLVDAQDLLAADAVAVDTGLLQLPTELVTIKENWRLFCAWLVPWVEPPPGDAATKRAALGGHESAVAEWLAFRRAHFAARELSDYGHSLCVHGGQIRDYFALHCPDIAPQDLNTQAQEHVNKLVKNELAPLMGIFRSPRLKNAFYYIQREWQVRLLEFPDTIHVRRNEKCGSCGWFGHRMTNARCKNHAQYAALARLKREAATAAANVAARARNATSTAASAAA